MPIEEESLADVVGETANIETIGKPVAMVAQSGVSIAPIIPAGYKEKATKGDEEKILIRAITAAGYEDPKGTLEQFREQDGSGMIRVNPIVAQQLIRQGAEAYFIPGVGKNFTNIYSDGRLIARISGRYFETPSGPRYYIPKTDFSKGKARNAASPPGSKVFGEDAIGEFFFPAREKFRKGKPKRLHYAPGVKQSGKVFQSSKPARFRPAPGVKRVRL